MSIQGRGRGAHEKEWPGNAVGVAFHESSDRPNGAAEPALAEIELQQVFGKTAFGPNTLRRLSGWRCAAEVEIEGIDVKRDLPCCVRSSGMAGAVAARRMMVFARLQRRALERCLCFGWTVT